MIEILNKNRRVWKKWEERHWEVHSVKISKGGPVIFRLTLRGAKEFERKKREEKKEEARIIRSIREYRAAWLKISAFGPDGKPRFC